jgi:TolB-like protein
VVSLVVRASPGAQPLIHFIDLRTPLPLPQPAAPGLPLLSFKELRAHDAAIAGGNERCRVVVARLANGGKRADAEWLSRELADSLATKLGSCSRMEFVTSDTAPSFERRLARERVGKINRGQVESLARRTGADVVVVGSYAFRDEKLIVNIQAMRPSNGAISKPFHLDGPADRVWELEGKTAAGLAEILGIRLSDAARERLMECPTASAAAFEEFCKGRQSPDGSHTKIQHLQKATEADPSFAEAHYLLGNTYFGIGMAYGYVEWFNMALEEYRRAASLAPRDPRAYCAMGLVYLVNGRCDLARRSLGDALRLDPEMKLARSYLLRLESMGL